jgi:pullulanase
MFRLHRPVRLILALSAAALLGAPVPAGAEAAPKLGSDTARIHYHRPKADYDGWGTHQWDGAVKETPWSSAAAPTGRDDFGPYWDVPLKPGATRLGIIVHKGDQKDPGIDLFLDLAKQKEAWIVSGRNELNATPPDVSALAFGDLSRAKAHWVDRRTILWPGAPATGATYALNVSPTASLRITRTGLTGGTTVPLRVDAAGMSAELRERFPYLAGATVLQLDEASGALAREWLRGQVAVSSRAADGSGDATGVQLPGVLDDLLAWDGPLGITWKAGVPSLRVWAPTAQKVRVLLFDAPRSEAPVATVDMTRDGGTWTAPGQAAWKNRYYVYEVTVFTPSTGRVETVQATDPYSRGLSRNGQRSLIVDLDDPALKPAGWDATAKPALAAVEDAVVYELHVRDFSASDASVPAAHRGTYLAFTDASDGTKYLRSLATAGLTHVHLLPAFDFATVNEDRTAWKDAGDLSALPADSDQQQAAAMKLRGQDGFNWGYDPAHYGVPEGSYATDPDGAARIVEFRRMVQSLAGNGLRVVMDVVYNHTHASGLAEFSVLDRIVPGYYQRLNVDGVVENSTCCANTASEHRMMEKLIADDLVHWARDYKVDGFRFDLMGHHMKSNLVRFRAALDALTPAKDGVDGPRVLTYGEGWDFGEVAGNKRGVNATQKNLAGTGVATFNDRIRDAVRGGSPFTDRREQGFATGLFTMPGEFNRGGDGDRAKLLDACDRIRVGLAGNLAGYTFTDRKGNANSGAGLGATGYASQPREAVNYVEAHDNETLWDKVMLAAPAAATLAQRVRMQLLALSVPALGQGLPFFHAGGELLRSKSMDADSYDSGDWFNRIDWTRTTNHWGMGLPGADKNRDRWPLMKPLLARRDLTPGPAELTLCSDAFADFLRIRHSSPLFRLHTAEDVQARVRFLNTGPSQQPGLIVMTLSDVAGDRPSTGSPWKRIVVLVNSNPGETTFRYPVLAQWTLALHPAQTKGADPVVKQAKFDRTQAAITVPGLTTAVFVGE